MSFADLKQEVEQLSPEQRREVAVLLSRLMDAEEGEQLATELAERHRAMDAGQKTSFEALQQAHERLIGNQR
jgi:hypothetical protein